MEIKTQQLVNDCINAVGSKSIDAVCTIDTSERGGAHRILSVSASSAVTQVETVEGQARVEGRVNYKLLYLDGEGRPAGLDYYCDWQTVVEDPAIDASYAKAISVVADDHAGIRDNVITLTADVDIEVYQAVSTSVEAIVEAECECLETPCQLNKIIHLAETRYDVADEIETGENIERVLLFDARCGLGEIKPGPLGNTLEGVVLADVVYLVDGNLKSRRLSIPFGEELELDGEISGTLSVKSARIVVSGEENNSILRVETVLSFAGYRHEEQEGKVVADMYAPDLDLAMTKGELLCRKPAGHYHLSEKVSAQTPIGEETGNVGRVVCALPARLSVANWVPGEDSITMEGLAVVSVVGEGDGIVAATVELPFSATCSAQGVTEDSLLQGTAYIGGVEAVIKGGVLEVTALIKGCVECYQPVLIEYVSKVEEAPAAMAEGAAISVYFPSQGETLWDVARAVRVSPKELAALNPDMGDKPQRVIVFRHQEI